MEDEHEWHISLEVFNPRPRETYRLKFHASPVNILSPTTCVVVFTEAKQDLVFKFLNSLESCPPQYVHVYLFADMIDRDGLTQQLLLCVGHGEWSDLTQKQNTIVLSDIENLVQANVRIHMAKEMAFTKTQCPVFDHHLFQTQKDYAEKIREAYSKLKHDQDQSFFYTDTPIGKMPLWTFPYMASRTKFDEDEVQRVMWNWFRIACIITGITTEDFKEQSVLVKAEIVGEMLTLMSRSQLYVNDTVRLDDGRLRATDQWVMLNTFPGPTSAAFDCEDGAMMILSFWSCFKRMSSAAHLCQEKLFPLNDFILQYNAFLALGKLKVKDKYVAHAFVVLLPVSVAARMINNVAPTIEFHEKLVPIVLESTAYTASINRWGNRLDSIVKYRYLTEDRVIYEKEEAWIRRLQRTDYKKERRFRRMIRHRAPYQMILDQKMYGDLAALISCERDSSFLYHWLMKKGDRMGVVLNDLIAYRWSELDWVLAAKKSVEEFETEMRPKLQLLPPCFFPNSPTQSLPKILEQVKKAKYHWFIRERDYYENKKDILVSLESWANRYHMSMPLLTVLPLTENTNLMMFTA